MRAAHALAVCAIVTACSSGAPAVVEPAPVATTGAEPTPPDDAPARARAALAGCERGADFLSLWASLDEARRRALVTDGDRALALQAEWELHRVVRPGADEHGTLDRASASAFLDDVNRTVGAGPPGFWSAVLPEGIVYPSGVTAYPTVVQHAANRYVAQHRVLDGVLRTRGDVAVEELADGRVRVRTRTGMVELAASALAVGADKPTHLEALVTTEHAVIVPFDGASGGFPFEVRAFDAPSGVARWTASACAAGRTALGGEGAMVLAIDLAVDTVVVWGAESHGVWLDAFDLGSGDPAYRFSSDLWMARQGP
jgi:hypothetical protein